MGSSVPENKRLKLNYKEMVLSESALKSLTSNTMRQRLRLILSIFIVGTLLFLIAVEIVHPVEYPNSDFFTFWLSGSLITAGQNPYSPAVWVGGHHQFGATWIPNTTFIYPLPVAYLFVALAHFPLYQAFILWVFLSQIMIVLSLVLLLRLFPMEHSKRFALPLFLGMVLFRPTIVTLINGQLSGFLLFLIVSFIYLWEKKKWWQGSILLPLLILKPNLGVPLVALLSLYLITKKQVIPLLVGGASGVGILLTGFLVNSNWIAEFWQAGNTKLSQIFGFAPTIWGVSSIFCQHRINCSLFYGGMVSLLLIIGFLYLLSKNVRDLSPLLAASIAITFTLLMTPTAWPYDQLLLVIPIVTVTMELSRAGLRFLQSALVFLAVDVLAFLLLGMSAQVQTEIWNALIPFTLLGLLAWFFLDLPFVPRKITEN